LKGTYFSVRENESLGARRWQRITSIRRIPFLFYLRILKLYVGKLFGSNGSEKENAENYYFLTLINCDAYSVSINSESYIFKNKNGINFIARKGQSSDLEVFNQVWGREEYSKATDIVRSGIKNRVITIIDAGANVGYSSLFFYQCFPEARIISVEPDENNYSALRKNISLNNASKIEPLNAGIWSHRCNLRVDKGFRDNREWSFQVKEVNEETNLKGFHILDIMEDFELNVIDLLKIDIEGAEKYLFDNTEKTAKFLSKTNVLAIEIHDEEVDREFIYDILTKFGFSYINYSDLTIARKIDINEYE
jgi:FkbM family methyltransferase